jgi:hypothetical protein
MYVQKVSKFSNFMHGPSRKIPSVWSIQEYAHLIDNMTCVEDILNYGYIKNLANLRSHCLFFLSVYIYTVYAHCTV